MTTRPMNFFIIYRTTEMEKTPDDYVKILEIVETDFQKGYVIEYARANYPEYHGYLYIEQVTKRTVVKRA